MCAPTGRLPWPVGAFLCATVTEPCQAIRNGVDMPLTVRDKYDRPLGVRLPRELRQWYECEADITSTSVNKLIVEALDRYRVRKELKRGKVGANGKTGR